MNSSILMMALSQFAHQIPILGVCVAAIFILLPRRSVASKAIAWAIAGFGLSAALSITLPIVYTALTAYRAQTSSFSLTWIYSLLGVFSSLLHATSLLLLLTGFLHFCRQPRA
jgi:hypothetical protein